MIIKPLEKETL